MGPRDDTKYQHPTMSPQLRAPPESLRKSLNFKPVFKAPNVTKIKPKAIQKIYRWHRNQQNPNICKKLLLHYLLHQMLDSAASDIQIHPPESWKNLTCKHAWQKTHLLFQSWPTTLKCGPKSTQNRQKSKPGLQGLPSRAPKSPWIGPWPPRVPNWRQQACQMTRFGNQNWQHLHQTSLWILKHVTSKLHLDTSEPAKKSAEK